MHVITCLVPNVELLLMLAGPEEKTLELRQQLSLHLCTDSAEQGPLAMHAMVHICIGLNQHSQSIMV